MRKGFLVGMIIVATIAVGGLVLFLTQTATKNISISLTFGEKNLIEDKIKLDSEEIFLQNGLWVASGEASYYNGNHGGLYKEPWDTFNGFTVWKDQSNVEIPSEDTIRYELLDNTKEKFDPYLQHLEADKDSEPYLKISKKNGNEKVEASILLSLSSKTLSHNIYARPASLSSDVSRYFQFYRLGKKFTENSDALIDHMLWNELNKHDDHDSRTVTGSCPGENIKEPTKNDIKLAFSALESQLNSKFSSEKIKWNIEVLDSDITSTLYTHEKKSFKSCSCKDVTCNKDNGKVIPSVVYRSFLCWYLCTCGGFKHCKLSSRDDSCTISNCKSSCITKCRVHYDKSYSYTYLIKVELIEDDTKRDTLVSGEAEKIKMVFIIKGEAVDNLCGGDHACDTGTGPAPDNPYPSSTVDGVFG